MLKQITRAELDKQLDQIPFPADYHRKGLYAMHIAAGLPIPQRLHQFPVPEARQLNRKDRE